jgi:crossover junction endodeoxyribonuclease RuvC
MIMLGIDPGFANIGIGIVKVGKTDCTVLATEILRTKKADKKVKVYVADDNVRRIREAASSLIDTIEQHDITAICAEAMSFPRNASSAAKMALFWGALIAIAHERDLPLYSATPQQIKKTLCGKNTATKEDIARAVDARIKGPVPMVGIAKGKQEHAYDGIAAVLTCIDSDELKLVRKLTA